MPLTTGTRLGAYEVLAPLGQGGMGEVYRARDTKLNRDVALKILPDVFASNPDRVARFTREAQTLAALNHPNIAAIYGLENNAPLDAARGAESDSRTALVMELVEGRDLSAMIGPSSGIPFEDALAIARQIADALEAAHDAGVIHRDLKPANVKVRDDGTVKVLDFGLAKAMESGAAKADGAPKGTPYVLPESPTMLSPAMTELGMILGTASYMSPEQAKGRVVDKRADIWAFGVVLYEMLTGRALFDGDSVAETIGLVATRDPDWAALPASTPAGVRRLLARCLTRDPKHRLRDIGDARHDLNGDSIADAPLAAQAVSGRRRVWLAPMVATGVTGVLVGAAAMYWIGRPPESMGGALVFQLAAGEQPRSPQISPDGRMVAYVRSEKLVVRVLETGEIRQLDGADGAASPFWSRDSASIGYFRGANLTIIAARGGPSRVITRAWAPAGAAWCSDDITYSGGSRSPWLHVAPDGTTQRQGRLDPASGDLQHLHASCLPDGRVLGIIRRDRATGDSIAVFGGPSPVELHKQPGETLANPVWSPSGHVLFVRQAPNAGIWSVAVSPDFSKVEGAPVMILADGLAPHVSSDGTFVAISGLRTDESQLVWVDRAGRVLSKVGRPHDLRAGVAAAPDGTRVAAFGRFSTNTDPGIWVHRGETAQKLTDDTPSSSSPAWSPTGDRMTFAAILPESGLWMRPSDGGGAARLLVSGRVLQAGSWSPDGRWLVYNVSESASGSSSVWIAAVDGNGARQLVKAAEAPAISPDGKWLVYQSNSNKIFLTTFPAADKIWPVSPAADSARHPRWNPLGGELFYGSGASLDGDPSAERFLYAVKIDTRGAVTPGEPQRLFDAPSLGLRVVTAGGRAYDVGPDGQRFVVATSRTQGDAVLTVVKNVGAWMRQER